MIGKMTDETLTPIARDAARPAALSVPLGRRADKLAAFLAGFGAVLSLVGAVWFFLGFAENDTRFEHLTSAFVFTLLLFAFAVVPFGFIAYFARRAHKVGTNKAHLIWTLFLMLPWVILGSLAMSTPLPLWCGLIMVVLAVILSLWALISLILDRKTSS